MKEPRVSLLLTEVPMTNAFIGSRRSSQWTMDIVSEFDSAHRKLFVLYVYEEAAGAILAAIACRKLSAERTAREFSRLLDHRSPPAALICNHGDSKHWSALQAWGNHNGVPLFFGARRMPLWRSPIERLKRLESASNR